jgi:hypothetical protein
LIVGVTGTPGSGKSYICVRKITDNVLGGKMVVTNVPLRDGWELVLALRNPIVRLLWWLHVRRPARRRAERFTDRVAVVKTLDELMDVQLGCQSCGAPADGRCGHHIKEGRGIAVVDEAHEWLNARMWDEDKELRARYVNWFSTHRHNGWDVYLVSQHLDSLDKQVRDRVEYHVTLRNLRNAKFIGIPVVPFNVFLAIWVWAQTSGGSRGRHVNKREFFKICSLANLYSTHGAARPYDPARPLLPKSSALTQDGSRGAAPSESPAHDHAEAA